MESFTFSEHKRTKQGSVLCNILKSDESNVPDLYMYVMHFAAHNCISQENDLDVNELSTSSNDRP